MRLAALFAFFVSQSACVCGDPSLHGQGDDPGCPAPDTFAAAGQEAGLVTIDRGGDASSIRVGPQGGCMVTPSFCVEAPWLASRPDTQCLLLSVDNEIVSAPEQGASAPYISPGATTMVTFEPAGDGTYCTAPVWNYLDDCVASLDGITLRMQLEARGSDGDVARGTVDVVLHE